MHRIKQRHLGVNKPKQVPEPKRLSVVITSYNHAHYLPQAIESVLQQDYAKKEILVVDDGSTDNTKEVASRFPDVKYVYQTNAGLSAARNTGIDHSTGEYLVFLDADDWFLKDAFTESISALEANPDAAFVYGGHVKLNEKNEELPSNEKQDIVENHYRHLLVYNFIAMHAAVFYRRWVFDKFRFDTSLKACEDYDLYLKITRNHPVVYHQHKVAAYRKHSENMSGNVSLMIQTGLKVMRRQLPLLQNEEERQQSAKGMLFWKSYYGEELYKQLLKEPALRFDRKRMQDLRTLFACGKRLFLAYANLKLRTNIKSIIRRKSPAFLLSLLHDAGLYKRYTPLAGKELSRNEEGRNRNTRSALAGPHHRQSHKTAFMNLRQFVKRFLRSPKVVVLMYHRVAEVKADPWQLAVSPQNFEAQLKLLRKKYKVITPQQLLKQNPRWQLGRNRVCITFDDGYLDNFTTAKPLLEKHHCTATFFITTHSLQTAQPYWWDELQEIIFSTPKLPSPFLFEVAGTKVVSELENNGSLTPEQEAKQNKWIWSDEPLTQRCRLYFLLWEKMRFLPQSEIEALLVQLKEMIGATRTNVHHSMPMTAENLKAMSQQRLFQIGLHTHTHPSLPDHSAAVQRAELEENKKILECVCDYPMTLLSYPHGRFNDDTLSIVKDMKLTAAFTTMPEPVMSYSHPFQLGRYQVLNWNEETFDSFLKKIFAS